MKNIFILLIMILYSGFLNSQQININRIEQMPNMPSPYLMRDWKQVAIGYDSLVFNFNLSGEYLPLGKIRSNTVNYPSHNSFILHTVVGTPNLDAGEAINCLPALISASLVGIDKSNQNGTDWIIMAEEWFNNRPAQNVYKNHPVDDSYNDWWYTMMPNVFFYQLYDLYPNIGDFEYQFTSVADQWLKAVYSLGGDETPWTIPNMNYRGFDLRTMQPYSANPPEPESAGSIAWLLYNAYTKTGNESYRIGAELAMEFLSSWESNPSYELQLPYGVYTAARMNAELGTNYDTEKMINWCFDIGQLRNWGAVLGTWDGIDVHGLIGESIINDYVFSMNTFEQIGALVPLVRYDDRFARAIGKWVLNAANASRLFYPNYLPGFKQDSEEWAYEYDPNSYIAHEAMREEGPGGWSPYATGDAISGGWGATNLSLYSSSHVGILGGIIDTTNIEGILKLDLLKTDYFNSEAYPTYLLYNPYSEAKEITIKLPVGNYDLYDAVSNTIKVSGVNLHTSISIDGDKACVLVVIPSGALMEYELNKTLVNNVIIDYSSGLMVANYPPRIKSISVLEEIIAINSTVNLFCSAEDLDQDDINYVWSVSGGTITGQGSNVFWNTPESIGQYAITSIIDDGNGASQEYSIIVNVVESVNHNPVINDLFAVPRKINLGGNTEITCLSSDEDNDHLDYDWSAEFGNISGVGNTINWNAPTVKGNYSIKCTVSDNQGGFVSDSIIISVRDLSSTSTGNLICYYPFNGNVNDESGNGFNGTLSGAVFVNDRFNAEKSALKFDGDNDNINVSNNPELNFAEAISINFWMTLDAFLDREQYPISHGNWERRWKVSVSSRQLRWTVKTASGIVDLDSETELNTDSLYNFTVIYSGSELEIYINGNLDAFKEWTGDLAESNLGLSIGQSIPGDNNYNFGGTLDDIRIYDYPISLSQIADLYDIQTEMNDEISEGISHKSTLFQNYPNPFNGMTTIRYQITEKSIVKLEIYNSIGEKIKTLINEIKDKGNYSVQWDSKDTNLNLCPTGVYFLKFRNGNHQSIKKTVLLK